MCPPPQTHPPGYKKNNRLCSILEKSFIKTLGCTLKGKYQIALRVVFIDTNWHYFDISNPDISNPDLPKRSDSKPLRITLSHTAVLHNC